MLFSLIRPAKEYTDSGVLTEAVEKNSSGLSDRSSMIAGAYCAEIR